MCPGPDPAWAAQRDRVAAAVQRAHDRHLTRRAVWREAGGDRARFTEIMRARLAQRPERTDREIWRDFLHRAILLVIVHCMAAAMICRGTRDQRSPRCRTSWASPSSSKPPIWPDIARCWGGRSADGRPRYAIRPRAVP
ncbi:hypothetical protein Acsp04_63880 [Actinomadura sp. NBRC 104425]|nr:hypothetical protein Acsp04_63880 [Actinomadura sp. NBRC 104425]